MEFMKMEALGNDFLVIDGPLAVDPEEVLRWCDRRLGIGADGVVMATRVEEGLIRMDYWNADGGRAETCGNGIRCAARYAFDHGWSGQPSFVIETSVGESRVTVMEDGSVRASLGFAHQPEEPLLVAGMTVQPVSLGNPHAVVLVEDPYSVPVEELGPRIAAAFSDGANVEFVTARSPDLLELRVWERGVGETLACGTGGAAAAAAVHRLGQASDHPVVVQPGGELQVELTDAGVWITGPVRYTFRGVWMGDRDG